MSEPGTGATAFIQARMSSSRLPGKVLEPLLGLPAILFMIHRVRQASLLGRVVVVTSEESSDDPLVETLQNAQVACFRGALKDVLGRFHAAAEYFATPEIVRLTADCPLIDPAVIDMVVRERRGQRVDYASNVDPPTFPDGLDVECFSREALRLAHKNSSAATEREHVTPWMRSPISGLGRANLRCPVGDLAHLRLTVDYPDDLRRIRTVLGLLAQPDRADLFDLLRVLSAHPELITSNTHARNEASAQ